MNCGWDRNTEYSTCTSLDLFVKLLFQLRKEERWIKRQLKVIYFDMVDMRDRTYDQETKVVICSQEVIFEENPSMTKNVVSLPLQQASEINKAPKSYTR